MITTVLVWTLTLMNPSEGGIAIQSDIATWADCERMRLRASQINQAYTPSRVMGTCTQVSKIFVLPDPVKVPTPQVVVQPTPVHVQPPVVTVTPVIVREAK